MAGWLVSSMAKLLEAVVGAARLIVGTHLNFREFLVVVRSNAVMLSYAIATMLNVRFQHTGSVWKNERATVIVL